MADLAALIVNYNSGDLARGCHASAMAEAGRMGLELETCVVDNDSPDPGQEEHLAALEAAGAHVIRHPTNSGYAAGMNLAASRTTAPLLLVSNPDLVIPEGSLAPLLEVVKRPEAGAVAPYTSIDPLNRIRLPMNRLPDLADHWSQVASNFSPAWHRRFLRIRSREALSYWSLVEPTPLAMLSGSFLVMRREVFGEVGGFDAGYPLYYEDADLFRRIAEAGYQCLLDPRTFVQHLYSRSVVAGDRADAMERYLVGQRRYYRRFYGAWGNASYRLSCRVMRLRAGKALPGQDAPVVDLGRSAEPVTLPVPLDAPCLLEICQDPAFFLAGGYVHDGGSWTPAPAVWDALHMEMPFFVRCLDLSSYESVGLWTFTRAAP